MVRLVANRLSRLLICFPILFGLLYGCGNDNDPFAPLSETELAQLADAWTASGKGNIVWQADNGEFGSTFYGRFDGSLVLFVAQQPTNLTVMHSRTVAGYKFYHSAPFEIYVCTSGQILTLEEAFETNTLTQEQIGQIYEYHKAGA